MNQITFVTGNANKFYEASNICREYDIALEQSQLDIDEIQHHNPQKITEAKARAAYKMVGAPVVVNDSSWAIPALGGFPGGYMKDVAAWLNEQDFLALMKDKTDRSIILTEVVAYCDGTQTKLFTFQRHGTIIDAPRGTSPTSFNAVVVMDGDGMTIAEKLADKSRAVDVKNYQHWREFAEWYKKELKVSSKQARTFYFGKLVRDETVPGFERDESVLAIDYHTMDSAEYKRELLKKLHEESDEIPLQDSSDEEVIAEIADVQDVLDALAKAYGISEADIAAASKKKAARRGGFENADYVETITVTPGSQWEEYCLNDPEKYPEVADK